MRVRLAYPREYAAWRCMTQRCRDPAKTIGWRYYGGRGIRVHPEWQRDFYAFYSHIGPAPSPVHQVDRIDSDGDDEPGTSNGPRLRRITTILKTG